MNEFKFILSKERFPMCDDIVYSATLISDDTYSVKWEAEYGLDEAKYKRLDVEENVADGLWIDIRSENMYDIGDIVTTNGQHTRFFEVINKEDGKLWISDGNVQVTRTADRLKLICKAQSRHDEKVPLVYWHGK